MGFVAVIGRRAGVDQSRALLLAMVLCGVTDQPMLATAFRNVLFRQISPAMRHALGVPSPPGPGDHNGWDNVYRNVRTRLHALLELMDPSRYRRTAASMPLPSTPW